MANIPVSTEIDTLLKSTVAATGTTLSNKDAVAALGAVVTGGAATGLNMSTARILGRTTASAGAVEEITVGSGLSLTGGNLTATGTGALPSTQIFVGNGSNVATAVAMSGDIAITNTGLTSITSASTNGGADKIPKFDANGDLRFSGSAPAGAAASVGGVFFQDLERAWFLNTSRTDGASVWFNTVDYPGGGEFQIASPNRIAFGMGVNGAFQIGTSLTSGKQYAYFPNRHPATAGVTTAKSLPLFFKTQYWNGAATDAAAPKIQAVTDGVTGSAFLDVYNPATMPDGAGGDGTETLAMRVSASGVWESGKAPAWDILSEAAPVQTCSIYKTVQAAKLTLNTASRTLTINGAVLGMRGVIYVKQSGAGSYLLTLPTNSAKVSSFALSTTPGLTDRLQWEFDGSYYFWTISNAIEVPLDADVVTFIAAGRANISDATQKDALNNLVSSLKASNVEATGTLWSKFSVLYPFVGGNANAHSRNLKSTSYDITWVNTATHNASGVTGIIANSAYGNTGFNMALLGQDSASLYVYNKTASPSTSGQYLLAAQNAATSRTSILMNTTTSEFYTEINQTSSASVGYGGSYAKHFAINRSGAATVENYVNSTRTNKTNASVAPWSGNLFLLARNISGAPGAYTEANIAFTAFGSSLTEAEWTAFRAIIDTFQTALTRANA